MIVAFQSGGRRFWGYSGNYYGIHSLTSVPEIQSKSESDWPQKPSRRGGGRRGTGVHGERCEPRTKVPAQI